MGYHFSDSAVTPPVTTATTSATKPTETTTTTTNTPVTEGVKGDANTDGSVDIADVVAIAAYVSDPKTNALTAQGIANADVQGDNGINATDALTVQQYLAGIIKKL